MLNDHGNIFCSKLRLGPCCILKADRKQRAHFFNAANSHTMSESERPIALSNAMHSRFTPHDRGPTRWNDSRPAGLHCHDFSGHSNTSLLVRGPMVAASPLRYRGDYATEASSNESISHQNMSDSKRQKSFSKHRNLSTSEYG